MTMLVEIDRYLRATGMSPSRFGRLAVNDPRLVQDLRKGRTLGRSVVLRIECFIAGQREDRA